MFKFLKKSFSKFKNGLAKTRALLTGRLKTLFSGSLDDETYEKLEQLLFEADLGSTTSMDLVDYVRAFVRKHPQAKGDELIGAMKTRALEIFAEPSKTPPAVTGKPDVILIVGVNGSGKTTTIAKLAARLKSEGKSVMLAAGDTFRAAAVEQLDHWAQKIDVQIVKGKMGSDAAAVVYDALKAAQARSVDTLIIDTAGRLQNKTELMQELEKIKKTCSKLLTGAPHETLLVLDATTGQNGIDQVVTFHEFTPLTGVIMSKLDGSAKGGCALALYHKLHIPILWVGLGEKIDDFEPFDPQEFVSAMLGDDNG